MMQSNRKATIKATNCYLASSATIFFFFYLSSVISSASHLVNYDQDASSSSFGEPIFRLEPPSAINFANSQGTTIPCLVSGSPRPTITWYSNSLEYNLNQQGSMSNVGDPLSLQLASIEQSRIVDNVTNLREIIHNGAALHLLPFRESEFRPDIHSTEYRCVATNQLATIHSRSVVVQAGK